MKELFPFDFLNIAGPTSSGKTTLVQTFCQRYPSVLGRSRSDTTRELKPEDRNDYNQLSIHDFKKKIDSNEYLEWNQLKSNGAYYGTPLSEFHRILSAGKKIIASLDNYGTKQVREKLQEKFFNVYLLVSIPELRRRIILPESRVRDNPEKRLQYAIEENQFAQQHEGGVYDYILPYDHRTPHEAIPLILHAMRKKYLILNSPA